VRGSWSPTLHQEREGWGARRHALAHLYSPCIRLHLLLLLLVLDLRMDKKLILGRKKPKPKRRGTTILGLGSMSTFSRSGRKDYCSKPLTSESRARAEKAQSDGTLFLLERTLLCECGEQVGARAATDGPSLVPTLHYQLPVKRKRVNPSGKSGYYKR
jgi:hypothetical protein